MKKNIRAYKLIRKAINTVTVAASLFVLENLRAQNPVRFHFIAPVATINANFPGHTNAVGISLPAGYDIVEITAANQAAFITFGSTRIKYMYQQLQPGTPLRNRIDEVKRISGDTIPLHYFLVDDRNGLTHTSLGNFTDKLFNKPGQDNKYHVWPSGNGFATGATFQGRVRLGEYQMDKDQATRPGNIAALSELALHETFHTQLVDRWTKWNGYVTYGANGGHTINEILGDQEAPLNEGYGTFYGYTINTAGADTLRHFFTRTDYRYVLEGQSVAAGYPEMANVAARQRSDVGGVSVFNYRWMDVPGVFNLYNENNFTGFLYYYWQNAYGNTDTALAALRFAASAMWHSRDILKRYPTYVVNRLAVKMERYNASAAGQADGTKTSSMFPFAMLDLISHFSMTDAEYQEDHNRNYPDVVPRAFTEYFPRRAAIRSLVQADLTASPIRFEAAVQKIRDYCRTPGTIF